MSPKIRISRHGYTSCPSCRAHVRVRGPLADARCFFCSALILGPGDTVAGQSALARVASAGRSGLIAASLLGLGSFGACTSDPIPEKDSVGDMGNAPVYGLPADMLEPDATPGDLGSDMGAPEDTGLTDTGPTDAGVDTMGDVVVDVAVDPGFAPLYGVPADAIPPEADASEDAAEEDAHDDAADAQDASDPPPQALYGLPPTPKDAG